MTQLLFVLELDDGDFQPGSVAYQADFDTWGWVLCSRSGVEPQSRPKETPLN